MNPTVGVGITRLMMGGASESGAGALNLVLPEHNENHVWSSLGLDMGGSHDFGNGLKLQVRAQAGFQYFLTGGETDAIATFEGAPAGVDPMRVGIGIDRSHGYGSIGLDLINRYNATFGVDYSTIMDRRSSIRRVNFRVRMPF